MANLNLDLGKYKRIVQYFWDPEPSNDDASKSPIWCLGEEYPATITSPEAQVDAEPVLVSSPRAGESVESASYEITSPEGNGVGHENGRIAEERRGWPPDFLDDFGSRIWFTYRSHFPPIAKSPDPNAAVAMTMAVRLRSQLIEQAGFTSDTGWGCMIRSGQSLLANALVLLHLGRGWRRGRRERDEKQILSLFADHPDAPFSIHRFVQHGASACGKFPGEWFGPSATASCIRALAMGRESTGLRVYITGDGSDVYEDGFMDVARPDGEQFHPTLILVGIRLGIDRVTPVYWEALKASLQMPQSVGIAGGRPSSSHYFVGVQGHYFFYLDPHQTRDALPLHENADDYTIDEIESCHTRRLRRLHIRDMDPSMLLAFLIHDEADWNSWKRSISEVQGKSVLRVTDQESGFAGAGSEREGALDEVEILDDENEPTGTA